MAMGAMDPNVDLNYYRELDKKEAVNADGELLPEKQTLNTRNVSNFLRQRGITPENFDKKFTLATAIDLTSGKNAAGEREMNTVLRKTDEYLTLNLKKPGLLETMNESMAKSNIHYELEKQGKLNDEGDLLRGYYTYRTVKMYCSRMFQIREQFSENREKEKTKVEKSVKEDFMGMVNDAEKNFNTMDSKERLALVAGGLIGAVMLMSSDSPRVAKVREGIWTCMKIGGFAWLGNTLFKVLTGKSALDTVSDWTKSSVANESFWNKTFKTNAEKGEILRQSTVYLGNKDFMMLAEDYQQARNSGKNTIDVPGIRKSDMTPEQVYTALDVFFQRYPVESMIQKYKNTPPPRPTWREVVGTELVDDDSIEFTGNIVDRTKDLAVGTVHGVYNYLEPKARAAGEYVSSGGLARGIQSTGETIGGAAATVGKGLGSGIKGLVIGVGAGVGGVAKGGYEAAKAIGGGIYEGGKAVYEDASEVAQEAWLWVKGLYRRTFGKEGTDEEIIEWNKKTLRNWDSEKSGDLEKFIRENNPDKKKADGYLEAMRTGKHETINDVDLKHAERSGDAIYVTSSVHVNEVPNNQAGVLAAMKKCEAAARDFLRKKYPELGDDLDKYVEFSRGVYVVNDASYRVFMTMPLPGTTKFNMRKAGLSTPKDEENIRDKQIFGPDDKIEYDKLSDAQKKALRLRFYLDASQVTEIEAVCDKFTRMYATGTRRGLPKNVVMERILKNDEDRDEVLKALKSSIQLERKLFGNRGVLEKYESDIKSLEEKARGHVTGGTDVKMAFEETVRQWRGYDVRLALLGDADAMRTMKYVPGSSDESVLNTPEKLLDRYKYLIEQKAKESGSN